MDINQLVMSDEKAAVIEDGAWVGGFDEAPGVEFFVRGVSSDAVQQALAKAQIDARMKKNGEPLTPTELSSILSQVLAEVGLMDWRGLTDCGEPVKFDRELAKKWMTSRGGKRLALMVFDAARQIDDNAEKFIETVTKN